MRSLASLPEEDAIRILMEVRGLSHGEAVMAYDIERGVSLGDVKDSASDVNLSSRAAPNPFDDLAEWPEPNPFADLVNWVPHLHPKWPAGSPNGKGGEFMSKEDIAAGAANVIPTPPPTKPSSPAPSLTSFHTPGGAKGTYNPDTGALHVQADGNASPDNLKETLSQYKDAKTLQVGADKPAPVSEWKDALGVPDTPATDGGGSSPPAVVPDGKSWTKGTLGSGGTYNLDVPTQAIVVNSPNAAPTPAETKALKDQYPEGNILWNGKEVPLDAHDHPIGSLVAPIDVPPAQGDTPKPSPETPTPNPAPKPNATLKGTPLYKSSPKSGATESFVMPSDQPQNAIFYPSGEGDASLPDVAGKYFDDPQLDKSVYGTYTPPGGALPGIYLGGAEKPSNAALKKIKANYPDEKEANWTGGGAGASGQKIPLDKPYPGSGESPGSSEAKGWPPDAKPIFHTTGDTKFYDTPPNPEAGIYTGFKVTPDHDLYWDAGNQKDAFSDNLDLEDAGLINPSDPISEKITGYYKPGPQQVVVNGGGAWVESGKLNGSTKEYLKSMFPEAQDALFHGKSVSLDATPSPTSGSNVVDHVKGNPVYDKPLDGQVSGVAIHPVTGKFGFFDHEKMNAQDYMDEVAPYFSTPATGGLYFPDLHSASIAGPELSGPEKEQVAKDLKKQVPDLQTFHYNAQPVNVPGASSAKPEPKKLFDAPPVAGYSSGDSLPVYDKPVPGKSGNFTIDPSNKDQMMFWEAPPNSVYDVSGMSDKNGYPNALGPKMMGSYDAPSKTVAIDNSPVGIDNLEWKKKMADLFPEAETLSSSQLSEDVNLKDLGKGDGSYSPGTDAPQVNPPKKLFETISGAGVYDSPRPNTKTGFLLSGGENAPPEMFWEEGKTNKGKALLAGAMAHKITAGISDTTYAGEYDPATKTITIDEADGFDPSSGDKATLGGYFPDAEQINWKGLQTHPMHEDGSYSPGTDAPQSGAAPPPGVFDPNAIGGHWGNIEDANQWAADNYQPWKDGLSSDEQNALDEYKGSTYRDINSEMRDAGGLDNIDPDGVAGEYGPPIASALDAAPPLDQPVLVYRGRLPNEVLDAFEQGDEQGLVGEDVADPAFVSTSMDRGTARGFSSSSRYPDSMGRIVLPEGFKAGYMETPGNTGESELLLPSNTHFKITKAYTVGDHLNMIDAVAYMPDDPGKPLSEYNPFAQ